MFWLPACEICLLLLLIYNTKCTGSRDEGAKSTQTRGVLMSNTKCTGSRDEGAKSTQTRGVGILHYEAIN